jgi:hypothetical protein
LTSVTTARLGDLAGVVRSKNAEPYLTTIDVFFPDRATYDAVGRSGSLTVAAVAAIYGIPIEAVFGIYFVDQLQVVKVTLFKYGEGRFLGSGDPALADMIGAQTYVPLLDLEIAGGAG